MKKGIRIVGIAIICIGIIVGYYYYLSNHGKKDVENSTEISKVDEALSRDLAKDYPPTPREVVKFYNKLLQCFYNEDCSKSEIAELGGQARLLSKGGGVCLCDSLLFCQRGQFLYPYL